MCDQMVYAYLPVSHESRKNYSTRPLEPIGAVGSLSAAAAEWLPPTTSRVVIGMYFDYLDDPAFAQNCSNSQIRIELKPENRGTARRKGL